MKSEQEENKANSQRRRRRRRGGARGRRRKDGGMTRGKAGSGHRIGERGERFSGDLDMETWD